ncbi:MAG: hypothetical protein R6W94_08420 [Spirochaetia bacterium]
MEETTGTQTIEWLYHDHLQVDDEWSIRTAHGFRWWADRHAQQVEVIGEETAPDGVIAYVISVRTEVLRGLELTERNLAAINALIMPFAAMAGPVYDEDAGTLTLASLVRVHEEIAGWMNPMIGVAAALQLAEARAAATDWARELGAEEAVSGPSEHGRRKTPDELVNVVPSVVIPSGRGPSLWKPAEFEEAVARHMQQPPSLMASAGGPGLTVEFPYGDMSSLCRMNADTRHPRYGNGLHVMQSFPLPGFGDTNGIRLALEMNAAELAYRPFGYGFGSYTFGHGMLEFLGFFPNLVHKPGMLPNIYFSCAGRAHAMSARLMNAPWTRENRSGVHGAFMSLADMAWARPAQEK